MENSIDSNCKLKKKISFSCSRLCQFELRMNKSVLQHKTDWSASPCRPCGAEQRQEQKGDTVSAVLPVGADLLLIYSPFNESDSYYFWKFIAKLEKKSWKMDKNWKNNNRKDKNNKSYQ